MGESTPNDQEIEKLLKEEQEARDKLQDALRHTQPPPQEQPQPEATIPAKTPETPPKVKPETHPTEQTNLPITGIAIHKTKDPNTLVDVHVNNPMKRIVELLEDIKKQKAFSFTLKGSLGIMGVLLTLSIFGLFGGSQVLCDKGLQTRVGELRVLQITEEATDPSAPWSRAMIQKVLGLQTTTLRQRAVLIPESGDPIHINTLVKNKLEDLHRRDVAITGTLNTCSSTITLPDEASIERI